MDPAACRVIYIDDRFNTERWISREGATPVTPQRSSSNDFNELPADLQANVNAFLSVFNQVYVCRSGRSFSSKLSEIHDQVKPDCTPIIACFDVGSETKASQFAKHKARFAPGLESPTQSPTVGLRREMTFSSESDESYGLQLLSRIASDLQVDEGVQLIIPVGIVQPKRKDSYDQALLQQPEDSAISRAPYGSESAPARVIDQSDVVDPHLMLQCLDAGALDVVRSPLDKAAIMGLIVHAYRIYKSAKSEQKGFMAAASLASARKRRKQSWVGVEEEKPYAYLREAMVKKLLKGICEPQTVIEDYQHRDLVVDEQRQLKIADDVGKWDFDGHDFSEDELVYAGYFILNHALSLPELAEYRMPKDELLRFMQGCQVAYNSFVLYHNFRHAVDVLQSLFYFLLQIGVLPHYPNTPPPPHANDKSPVAKLIGSFEAMTLLISAIGHDVGHPGVNNMFLVKLNAPLAQLYNDQSVLEAFHCAAYSQILRRHWPVVFHDNKIRQLMISSILATDMGVHSDYMGYLGNLQSKIHESKTTDSWSPKEMEANKNIACGLLIKCADISNVARPWKVAEKWTHLLQKEFAHQGEMESAVGMETALFGGPPEIGNMLKLANGQIGFMTIFAHPLFANVADIIPAMGFAAEEILTNKGVWFTRAEHEKKKKAMTIRDLGLPRDGGAVSPRTQSPVRKKGDEKGYFPSSPLRERKEKPEEMKKDISGSIRAQRDDSITSIDNSRSSSLAAVAGVPISDKAAREPSNGLITPKRGSRTGNGVVDSLQSNHAETLKEKLTASRRSSHATEKAVHQPETTAAKSLVDQTDACGESELNDTRMDESVSMRAGSAAIPVETADGAIQAVESRHSELSKFTFATSEEEEPTRTFDPEETYQPSKPESRASAPIEGLEYARQKQEMLGGPNHAITTQSETSTVNVSSGGGTSNDNSTPNHMTATTSYTSDATQHSTSLPAKMPIEQSSQEQTASPPFQSPSLTQSYSLSSERSTSREGSKSDFIRSTVSPNGQFPSSPENEGSPTRDRDRTRKVAPRTVGRRGSKMKLKNLAFWKKKDRAASTTGDGRSGAQEGETSLAT